MALTVLSAVCCAIELGISGTVPAKIAVPAMAGIHAVIGLGEGFITVAALSLLLKSQAGYVVTAKNIGL